MARGGKTWFSLTADYAFGQDLEKDTTNVVLKSGGKVLGSVRHPLNTSDFSSFLLQAQASKAKVIGLANAGGDTINAIKQAAEFGIDAGRPEASSPLLLFVTDMQRSGWRPRRACCFRKPSTGTSTTTPARSPSASRAHQASADAAQAGVYSSVTALPESGEGCGRPMTAPS